MSLVIGVEEGVISAAELQLKDGVRYIYGTGPLDFEFEISYRFQGARTLDDYAISTCILKEYYNHRREVLGEHEEHDDGTF